MLHSYAKAETVLMKMLTGKKYLLNVKTLRMIATEIPQLMDGKHLLRCFDDPQQVNTSKILFGKALGGYSDPICFCHFEIH